MKVYALKFTKSIAVSYRKKDHATGNDIIGNYERLKGDYHDKLFRYETHASDYIIDLSEEYGFDKSALEVVSLDINEEEAMFCLFDIAFSCFPKYIRPAITEG